ncbi:NAD(P)-binding domain-containing protein [Pseudomonas sp. HY13-MNA-CIBAN-0226]|uniref:NAD(P)-dependent oxidoreductase n=1 Tax=Pseudomonas sp. HY13-MNA-CIBAN-0226 TaxID=3140473 RepID=UPI0033206BCC
MINVSVVGTGVLGAALISRFIECGVNVAAHNRTKSKLVPLVALGAKPIDDLANEIIIEQKIWFLCLCDEFSILEVFSHLKVMSALKLQKILVVNMSTIGPRASARLEAFFTKLGVDYVELPVSGGAEGVLSGELIGYVGKKPKYLVSEFDSLIKLLLNKYSMMSSNQDAQAMKVVNNYCEAINLIVASEALLLAQNLGMSKEVIGRSLGLGRGRSAYLELLLGRYMKSEKHVSVPLEIRIKDLELASDVFCDLNIKSIFYEGAREIYLGTLDSSALSLDQTECFTYLCDRSGKAEREVII